MTANRPCVRPHAAGFGLIELLVTLTVMGLVMAAVFMTLFQSQGQTRRMTRVAENRQMARTAIQLIEREARMSGSGWGRTSVEAVANNAVWPISAINPGAAASVNSSDSLTLLGAWGATTTTTAAMPFETSVLQVASVANFNTNDLVLVTDRDNRSADLFQVTTVNTGALTLEHATSSPYNATGYRTAWPAGGYAAGSFVYQVTMTTYKFDPTTYRRPALVRREAGQAWQVVAYDVDGFRVWYEMQGGAWTRNPGNLAMVDKVIPVVLTRVTDPKIGTLRDSVWASVRPRTF